MTLRAQTPGHTLVTWGRGIQCAILLRQSKNPIIRTPCLGNNIGNEGARLRQHTHATDAKAPELAPPRAAIAALSTNVPSIPALRPGRPAPTKLIAQK